MKKNCWIQDQEKHKVKKQEHLRKTNAENSIPRVETRSEERHRDQEIRRKEEELLNKGRG